jgi:hypothetical protein
VVPDVAGWFLATCGTRPALIQRKKGMSSFHSGRRATARTRNIEQNALGADSRPIVCEAVWS